MPCLKAVRAKTKYRTGGVEGQGGVAGGLAYLLTPRDQFVVFIYGALFRWLRAAWLIAAAYFASRLSVAVLPAAVALLSKYWGSGSPEVRVKHFAGFGNEVRDRGRGRGWVDTGGV